VSSNRATPHRDRDRRLGQDTSGPVGVDHSLWKPRPGAVQGLHRGCQGEHVTSPLHTTVTGLRPVRLEYPIGRGDARSGRVRDRRPWMDKEVPGADGVARRQQTLGQLQVAAVASGLGDSRTRPIAGVLRRCVSTCQDDCSCSAEGRVPKSLAACSTPLDSLRDPHRRRSGCFGSRSTARSFALLRARSVDIVEVLTSIARPRPLPRLARARQDDPGARQDPSLGSAAVAPVTLIRRARAPGSPPQAGLPAQRSSVLAALPTWIRVVCLTADDFYIALGAAKGRRSHRHRCCSG